MILAQRRMNLTAVGDMASAVNDDNDGGGGITGVVLNHVYNNYVTTNLQCLFELDIDAARQLNTTLTIITNAILFNTNNNNNVTSRT